MDIQDAFTNSLPRNGKIVLSKALGRVVSMKVYEAKTLITAMEARSGEYRKIRGKFVELRKAFMGMADLGDDFQGKGADNIKAFYREHAAIVDEWLDMIDMQIAFLDSISAAAEEAGLGEDTFVDIAFLEQELAQADEKSKAIVARQKKTLEAIFQGITDMIDLQAFSTADFNRHMSASKVKRECTVDKIEQLDSQFKKEYGTSEASQDHISARGKALMEAAGQGKKAQPIHFNEKAYYGSKAFKQSDEILKKTREYLAIKKEVAEKRRMKELKAKLEKVSDPDEYLEIVKEIGYENLDLAEKQYVLQLEQMNSRKRNGEQA